MPARRKAGPASPRSQRLSADVEKALVFRGGFVYLGRAALAAVLGGAAENVSEVGIGQFVMDWYYFIAWAAIAAQLLFVYYAGRNYRYVLLKAGRKNRPYRPRTVLIVPCKGLDAHFDHNIRSFLEQDYDNYRLFFVVAEESDPAYRTLSALQDELGRGSRGPEVRLLVAGPSQACSQKSHNLLCAIGQVPDDTEVLAFADSDVCVPREWLTRLVRPLWRSRCGATTGYRWFIPTRKNLASLALSALNGAVAQFLGNSPFNQAWGGSMAVRVADFRRLDIPGLWSNTLSDDLSLSRAVKRAGMRVTFVPDCLVASFESATWPRLHEFARRQLLITRIYAPGTWWLGFLSSLGSVAGLWGGAALAIYAAGVHSEHVLLYAAVPIIFFAGQLCRAVLRQLAAASILKEHLPQLAPAAVADIVGCWFWSAVLLAGLLSSALGRTIRWRGIRYKLLGPGQTEILGPASSESNPPYRPEKSRSRTT